MIFSEPPVYGLDIGTRSIVGTVGFMRNGSFCVAAQKSLEHETRAMLDGQIHDIHAVASTIRAVTDALRTETGQPLDDVCIAAAGRVLKTVTVHVDEDFGEDRTVEKDDIYALESKGIEEAYKKFNAERDRKRAAGDNKGSEEAGKEDPAGDSPKPPVSDKKDDNASEEDKTSGTGSEEASQDGKAETEAAETSLDGPDMSAGSAVGEEELFSENDPELKAGYYCVGYSVIRYYMNGYPMGNLEEHNAHNIGCDLIGTFLPDDVVDGLYKAVGEAGLQVVNMTLEPIAAIGLAIPDMYRMLNLALVDVGAGTTDISITRDGTITAYGMIPMAGDSMTEAVLQHCLTDFNTAEEIKRKLSGGGKIKYTDIMGLDQTMASDEIMESLKPVIDEEARLAAEKIQALNGGKSVSAVFVVGGGGIIPGYTERLSEYLGIKSERVAIRGKEVMSKVKFLNKDVTPDSLLVTPIGIALSYYEKSNSFIFVTFNGRRIKLYDNSKLEVLDCALQGEFPNDQLFPRRGNALLYTVNGVQRMTRGESGESAVITLNGNPADIHSRIQSNDIITVTPGTAGPDAKQEVGALPEFSRGITVSVNGSKIELPKIAVVNGTEQPLYYEIKAGDDVEVRNFYTIDSLSRALDVYIAAGEPIVINDEESEFDSEVHDGDEVQWTLANLSYLTAEEQAEEAPDVNAGTGAEGQENGASSSDGKEGDEAGHRDSGDEGHSNGVTVDSVPGTVTVQSAESGQTGSGIAEGSVSDGEHGDQSAESTDVQPADKPETSEDAGYADKPETSEDAGYADKPKTSDGAGAADKSESSEDAVSADKPGAPEDAVSADQPESPEYTGSAEATETSADRDDTGATTPADDSLRSASETSGETRQVENADADSEASDTEDSEETPEAKEEKKNEPRKHVFLSGTGDPVDVNITVNGAPVTMTGRSEYMFANVFDFIDVDVTSMHGTSLTTLLNGRPAEFLESVKEGDIIEVYWNK
ncbi:MAG: rod shape-determining protein [Lachnospiraceae bacterium]|nr:rod shape-determining protein [Lachnospiraceae bacterium]